MSYDTTISHALLDLVEDTMRHAGKPVRTRHDAGGARFNKLPLDEEAHDLTTKYNNLLIDDKAEAVRVAHTKGREEMKAEFRELLGAAEEEDEFHD